jgi:3-oxoacyl-[acyl-carrier-protein] synthase II
VSNDLVIHVKSIGSITPLGHDESSILASFRHQHSRIGQVRFGDDIHWAAKIPSESEAHLEAFVRHHSFVRRADRTVHLAVYASEMAVKESGWNVKEIEAINFGSSRGATGMWEEHYQSFLKNKRSHVKTSPYTTLGNISSHVATFFQRKGIAIDHSMTCSSGLLSIINGIAWLKSGLCQRFLAGASEAPITPFTLSQMQALGIYSKEEGPFPCKSLDLHKKRNTMVLGEGAIAVCLELKPFSELEKEDIFLSGWGMSKEMVESPSGISLDGKALLEAMFSALSSGTVPDLVIAHAPGTVQGDSAEWNAIQSVFGDMLPTITSTKWKTGHLLGASGLMSLEMGFYALKKGVSSHVPYLNTTNQFENNPISFMVNSIGFGGNAVSLIFAKK